MVQLGDSFNIYEKFALTWFAVSLALLAAERSWRNFRKLRKDGNHE